MLLIADTGFAARPCGYALANEGCPKAPVKRSFSGAVGGASPDLVLPVSATGTTKDVCPLAPGLCPCYLLKTVLSVLLRMSTASEAVTQQPVSMELLGLSEQKNPYPMMTKGGRCSAQPGLVLFAMGCSEVCRQFCILPSLLLTPSNTSKAEEKRKERRKSHTESGIDESTQAVIELGRNYGGVYVGLPSDAAAMAPSQTKAAPKVY
ncbi:hypothetical protein RLOC_00003991 [Lonchura striata]|uniref:Overexpressed in colon carcinoma 1 protein n=1 Tax=Lonchura striata TaxID=40157 RepID=A0A218UXH1_9PASE|nr:hypothetical protein RLOC_00003991 [Lonchura striata domestica]